MTASQARSVAICPSSNVASVAMNAKAARADIHGTWPTFVIGLGAVLTLAWMIFLLWQCGTAVLSVMI
jgi:hypothetical protein